MFDTFFKKSNIHMYQTVNHSCTVKLNFKIYNIINLLLYSAVFDKHTEILKIHFSYICNTSCKTWMKVLSHPSD